jgi:PKD repeat protein
MIKLQSWIQKNRNDMACFVTLCSILVVCVFSTTSAFAKDYTFAWSDNPEPVEGYKLYYKKGGNAEVPYNGTDASNGPSPIDLGKQTMFTISGLEDNTTYHFALTAYDNTGESGFTQAITVFPSDSSPSDPPVSEPPPVNNGNKAFTFTWNPSLESGTTAHRFYINDQFLCQSINSAETSLTCNADLLRETMYFSMTTVDSLGNESAKSNILIYDPPLPSKAFIFDWTLGLESGITAHRFYLNDQFLCQSTNSVETSLTCYADLLNETMFFSMTAIDTLGNESVKSNILTFNPTDTVSPVGPAATLSWEYDPADTTVAGYRIYHNNTLIGEITDPSVLTFTSDTPLDSTNVFEVRAYDSSNVETKIDSTITYTNDPTSSTGTLAAVIITNNQDGEAPLTVSFDAGASTGPIASYAWAFGDGDTATGATAAHTFQSAGTYTATLTVVDTSGSSQATNITITATGSTSSPAEDPTAVIASSSTVGDAPFTVNFDGSGSTTPQPPIISYSWDFGDGVSAEGVSVSHTYTLSGTFYPSLTVYDSAGLSNQITTPVIIGAGQTTNQPPTSSFTATPGYGASPLTVSLDGSGSSDPDGSIKSYLWSFGDGTTATGISTQHTFTDIANYTVTLLVTDNLDETAVSSQVISVRASGNAEFTFELQEIQINHNWTRFDFTQQFIDPVVVAGPMSFNEADPATIRVRNLDATGCEIRIQEWESEDGIHIPETLTFLVMERGTHTIDNGSKIEAGTFTGATSFKKIALQQTYSKIPVILSQVITENEKDAVIGRLRNIGTSSFEYTLQEREQTSTSHGTETIGYIAWEPGAGEVLGLPYEAGFTAKTVTDSWSGITFQSGFSDTPVLVAGIQTNNESDTATIRSRNLSENSVQIKIEEERSADEETSHAAEVVGYLTIGAEMSTSNPGTSSWVRQFLFTWESTGSDNITGYRFYLNDSILCESTNPDDRKITCQGALANETMKFTMTSVLLDNSETEPTVIFSISPEDYPDLFGIRLVTFKWEYDSKQESSISGFAIYNNDALVCETTNPGDRQLTCKVQLDSSNNAFTIKPRGINGVETSASNTLEFTP